MTSTTGATDPNLKKKTASSAMWTLVRIGTDQGFNFVIFVVLARLLDPAAFGLFAIAYLFAEIGKTLVSSGLVDAIIREPEITPALADTTFWANISVGIIAVVLTTLAAHPFAGLLGEPRLIPLVEALSVLPFITAIGATHTALRLREFGHRTMALRAVLGGLVGGGAALAAAFAGWGVWAFVVQRFVTEIIGAILAWRAYRWRPGLAFSWDKLKEIRSFSGNLLLSQLLLLLLVRLQDLIIGYQSGAAAVGVYRTAWKTIEVIAQATIVPLSFVAMPTLSRLNHDPVAFGKAYRRLGSTSALIALPAIVGFGLVADPAIVLLYGKQWGPSVPVAQILSFMAAPFVLSYFVAPALAAAGKSSAIFRISVVQLTLTAGLSWFAAPLGVAAVAGAYVLRAYITTPLQLWTLQHEVGPRAAATIKSIMPPLVATIAMVVAALSLKYAISDWAPLLRLIATIGLSAVVYAGTLLLVGGADLRGQVKRLNPFSRLAPA